MDRENFRRWFTFIAERAVFYHLSEQWNAGTAMIAPGSGALCLAGIFAPSRPPLVCKRWDRRNTPHSPRMSRVYTLEQGPLGEKAFSHCLWRLQRR